MKGGAFRHSVGLYENPEMKRFGLFTESLSLPTRPGRGARDEPAQQAAIPGFGDFFYSYFGGQRLNAGTPVAEKMLENLKRCYENHSAKADPVKACQFYIDGFQRAASQ